MGYIHTTEAHLAIRRLFKRRKQITLPQVMAELMKTDPESPANLPNSRESPEAWEHRQMLACEVVLIRLIEAGRVYPAGWIECLEFYLECEELHLEGCVDDDSGHDQKELKAIRRVLGGWRKKAPPWLDAGRARISRNLGWTACINHISQSSMDGMWELYGTEYSPLFIAGQTVQKHRLISGEDL